MGSGDYHGLFDSIDEKIDKIIYKEDKIRKASMGRLSNRDDPDLSESMLRSVVIDKEQTPKESSAIPMEKRRSQISFIDLAVVDNSSSIKEIVSPSMILHKESSIGRISISGTRLKPDNKPLEIDIFPSLGAIPDYPSPLSTPVSAAAGNHYQEIDSTVSVTPLLIKGKQKHQNEAQLIDRLIPVDLPQSLYLKVETSPRSKKQSPTLVEINNALQSILNDITPDSMMELILTDSNRRIESSKMWNIDTPPSTDRNKQSIADLLTSTIVDKLILELSQ